MESGGAAPVVSPEHARRQQLGDHGVTTGHLPNSHLVARARARHRRRMTVYAVVDDALSSRAFT